MSMTKKDYELIAKSIRFTLGTWSPDTKERQTAIYAIKDAATALADDLATQDKRFKREQFLKDCGVTN